MCLCLFFLLWVGHGSLDKKNVKWGGGSEVRSSSFHSFIHSFMRERERERESLLCTYVYMYICSAIHAGILHSLHYIPKTSLHSFTYGLVTLDYQYMFWFGTENQKERRRTWRRRGRGSSEHTHIYVIIMNDEFISLFLILMELKLKRMCIIWVSEPHSRNQFILWVVTIAFA